MQMNHPVNNPIHMQMPHQQAPVLNNPTQMVNPPRMKSPTSLANQVHQGKKDILARHVMEYISAHLEKSPEMKNTGFMGDFNNPQTFQ
jgi:hypothetical protein